MGRNCDVFFSVARGCADAANELAEFGGRGIANGVRNVDRGSAGFYNGGDDFMEECGIGAGGVLGRKFDIGAKSFCQAHTCGGLLQTLLAGDSQLVFEVNIGGREKHMEAGMGGAFERTPGALDVGLGSASEAGDGGPAKRGGNGLHG